MKDSKGSRSRYLVIEGGVIVLSILLTFGFDALWAQHQERLEEEQILASLKSDFVANGDFTSDVSDG